MQDARPHGERSRKMTPGCDTALQKRMSVRRLGRYLRAVVVPRPVIMVVRHATIGEVMTGDSAFMLMLMCMRD